MPTLTNYIAAQSLITDDYCIDLSCTDFPDLQTFLTAVDEALADMLDSMIDDYRNLPDWDIADDINAKTIRGYYAANDILTYDVVFADYLFVDKASLDKILAKDPELTA